MSGAVWRSAKLGEILKVRYGKALPPHERDELSRTPVVGSAGRLTSTRTPLCQAPLLVIGRKGSVGSVHEFPQGAWPLDTTYFVTVPTDVLDLRFLAYQLRSLELHRLDSSTAVPSLRRQDLERQSLRIPDLGEQRRIVGFLEDHLSRLDAALEYVRIANRRLVGLAQAARQQAIDSPASPMVPLAELVERIETGKSLGGAAAPAAADEWGIIKVSAMTWGEFRPGENKRIGQDLANPAYEIRNGDLLVSRANTSAYVGASVLVEEIRPRLLLSDKSLRLVPRAGVNVAWLNQVLLAPRTRTQVSSLATGTKDSMRNISQRALLSVLVPSTPADRQVEVATAAVAAAGSVANLAAAIARAEQRAAALRRALLGAAFSGRLSGPSTTAVDEVPAELERALA